MSAANDSKAHDAEVKAPEFVPPAHIEELFAKASGNKWSSINRPTAGPRQEQELPRGSASFQLYSLGTPNGFKVGIILEELDIDYDAHVINIGKGDQFGSGFVEIPAAVDYDGPNGQTVKLFESVSIMVYLAEKYGRFLPTDPVKKAEMFNWLFFQAAGQGPMTGNFGHFFVYAPPDKIEAREYGMARYGMEVLRITDVIERHLRSDNRPYILGEEYSIVDMALFPWFEVLRGPNGYNHPSGIKTSELLGLNEKFPATTSWAERIGARPAVQRGMQSCKHGVPKPWLATNEESSVTGK